MVEVIYDDVASDIPGVRGNVDNLEAFCKAIQEGRIQNVRLANLAEQAVTAATIEQAISCTCGARRLPQHNIGCPLRVAKVLERNDLKKIYDVNIDEFREITNDDIERLLCCEAALGYMLHNSKKLRETALLLAKGELSVNDAPKLP